MANNCFYDMKIIGLPNAVRELIKMLRWQDEFATCGLGRVYNCDIIDDPTLDKAPANAIIEICVCGDCAWSIFSAMRHSGDGRPTLESETKRLDLIVEAYSTEPGMGFQEHVIINRGNVITSACVDYEEHWVGEFDSIEAYNAEYNTNFTEDMIDDNGNVCIGGFGDQYGVFEISKDTWRQIDKHIPAVDQAAFEAILQNT